MGVLRKGGVISESTAVPLPVNLENLFHVVRSRYYSHTGAVDNYTQTGTAGGGTATETAATHRMVLSTALNAISNARYYTKQNFDPIMRTVISAHLFQTTADITAVDYVYFGLKTDFTVQTTAGEDIIMFRGNNNTWNAITQDIGGGTTNIALASVPITDAIFTIVLTASKISFYIDGAFVGTSVTNIPTGSMYIGCGVYCTNNLSPALAVGVDDISIEEFYA